MGSPVILSPFAAWRFSGVRVTANKVLPRSNGLM